jgi:hypothetical protein
MSGPRAIPNGLSPTELAAAYRSELERHTAGMILDIRKVLADPANPGETHVSVEVFPDESGEGRVAIGMYFHGVSPILDDLTASLGTSRNFSFGSSIRDMPRIDVFRYQDEVSISDMTVDQIKAWFADCWAKAGGTRFPLRVELFGSQDYGDGRAIVLAEGN